MFNRIMKVFNTGGEFGLAKKFLGNARYQLIDQWGLIYLELPLDKVDLSLPVNEAFNLRFATRDDISKIKSDIYINIQGDEPTVDPNVILKVAEEKINNPNNITTEDLDTIKGICELIIEVHNWNCNNERQNSNLT